MAAIRAGDTNLQVTCQKGPGVTPVMAAMSRVNLLWPYMYITDTSSVKAMKVSPRKTEVSNISAE